MSSIRPFSRFASPTVKTLCSCLALCGLLLTGCAAESTAGGAPAYEEQLAQHLTTEGATMYGAFWCPHCADQKELFGKAADSVPYVECDSEGEQAQPQLCTAKEIRGYPTWEINGEFYPGTQSLEKLAALSGFKE
ncbi:MAG: glutaredoxin family protein [Leptolyngbyaceae cyanobacterium]